VTLLADDLWLVVCRLDDLLPGRGVCVLVGDDAVALFRLDDDALHAVGNVDPYTGASVMSRGIVGTTAADDGQVPFVASPLLKHRFDLRTGDALDDPATGLGRWDVRVHDDGTVAVSLART
jgi:NAD(P)H-dependent nitrite reductase small subunit